MLSRQLLTLWKAYPNDYKEAVEVGKRTLKIHSRLRAEIKQKTDIVEVIFLHTVKTPIKRPSYFHFLDGMSLNCEMSLHPCGFMRS